ncbi:MAG: D-alanyl-D-alanine carboxypeptidase [Alphaproteobacteria bacterium]|nr:D-alanyl-D-alanine carboxypeptidase [Alphaproteobacteria bacterium]
MWRLLIAIGLLWTGVVQAQPMSCLLADVESGYIFTKQNIHTPLPPASLTKVMTLYLTFSALDKGWLKMNDPLPISNWAASQEPSNLDLVAGETITVREAILALIVKSANDVAVVLAEALAPSERDFAKMMTQAAAQLGMANTVFKNASGLHNPEQLTSAQDMAILTLATIKNFPQYYPLFSTQSFVYHGREYRTHNHVLTDYAGAEGFKTGYISAVGYNIISTAKKDDSRLVGIVIGDQSVAARDAYVTHLLDSGFRKVKIQKQAVESGAIQPAFDPLHRKAMVNKLNMAVFAPVMKYQTRRALARGKQLAAKTRRAYPAVVSVGKPRVLATHTENDWGIQIGAFNTQEKALSMANHALSLLNAPASVQTQRKNAQIYRSRLIGFKSKQMAQTACETLQRKNYSCFVVAPQGDR